MIQGMPNLTSSDGTTAQASVGDTYNCNGTTWMYCLSTAATIIAYGACSGSLALGPGAVEEATTTTVTAQGTAGGFACIPQFAVGAAEYFWAVVESATGFTWDGVTTVKVFTENTTAGAQLNSTATDGILDDAATKALLSVVSLATTTTAAATAFRTNGRMRWVA